MPYRTQTPLRSYPVRSRWLMLAIAFGLGIVCLLGVGLLMWGRAHFGWTTWLIALTLWLTTAAYLHSIKHETVRGGKGDVQLFARSVVVPPAFAGPPLHFPIDEVVVEIKRFESRVMFQTVAVVEVLHLRVPGADRGLSARMFEDPSKLRELAEDIMSLKRGAGLPSRTERTRDLGPASLEHDAYDELLEAELDALD